MFPHQTGIARPQNVQGGRSTMGGYAQCMEQCCNPHGSSPWIQAPSNYHSSYHQTPSVKGRLAEMRQALGRRFPAMSTPSPYNMHSGPMGGQALSPYSSLRAPSYNGHNTTFSKHPNGDPCATDDFWSGQNMGGDGSGFTGMSWSQSYDVDPSCDPWASMMTGSTPFSSSGGYSNPGWPNPTPLGNNSMRPAPSCPNPQLHQGYTEDCNLKHYNPNPSLFTRIMNRLRPPPPKCPLKPRVANPTAKNAVGGMNQSNSCFRPMGSSKNTGDAFESLDDLWNPRKIRRWGCINNWDQHKESQWKQVIENKMGNCGPAGRSVENKVHEALDALHQEGADCIAFRMFYGILKRNEDVYLNPYLSMMTDEECLRLIVALNNFYFEDKDKAKMFLDHPPPTWIEKIMQKETLAILDPNSRAPSIARRFWELLLDWYVQKLVAKGDPSASCAASQTNSQSSFGSL